MPKKRRSKNSNSDEPVSGRCSWNPPSADHRRGALGKVRRPSGLVAACQDVPCYALLCAECEKAPSSSSSSGPCPHSDFGPGDFEPKIRPRPGDWLADGGEGEDERKGQTFDQFNKMKRSKPSSSRHTLYLCNMDDTGEGATAAKHTMECLRQFVELFFGMPCLLMEPLTVTERKKLRGRSEPLPQLLTGPLHSILDKRKRKIKNAFAVAGVTMVDLYPDREWNYVFGEACPEKGVGLFSFARFTPQFQQTWDALFSGQKGARYDPASAWPQPLVRGSGSDDDRLVFLRAAKTLAHEIGHLFGLEHCVFYQCVMNGSSHLDESDESPLHLCPVCLRKLYQCSVSLGKPWDIPSRYEQLSAALLSWGLLEQAQWYQAASDRCRERLSAVVDDRETALSAQENH